jgi:hypothetical protein
MSIVKNVSGPYTINTINHDDPIILDSNVVIINGNLQVIGASTNITSTDTAIYDNIITLNAGITGIPTLNAGVQVERGNQPDVEVRWYEAQKVWQITNDGTNYANIQTFLGSGGGGTGYNMQRLADDTTPGLGGNVYTNGFAITANADVYVAPGTTGLTLDGNLVLKKYLTAPVITNNYVTVQASNAATGGTGLYVTNDEGTVQQELITKARAVVYSIIF